MSAPGFNSYFSGVSCTSTRQCRSATNRRMNIHEEQSSPSDRIESNLPGIIPVIHMAPPRFHHSVTAIILIHALHAAATPAMVSAESQEMPRRHSLIHHSAVEATLPSATTHGRILQSSSDQPNRITTPIEPPIAAIVPPAIELPYRRTSAKRPVMASIPPPAHIPHSAPMSDIAAGQDTPTTTDAGKGTIPTTAPPNTTSMTALPAGMASTNSHVATPPTPSPLAGAAGVHSTASAGGGKAFHWQLTIDIEPVQKLCHRELVATTDTCDHHTPLTPSPVDSIINVSSSQRIDGEGDTRMEGKSGTRPGWLQTLYRHGDPAYTISLDRRSRSISPRAPPPSIFRKAKPISSPCPHSTPLATKACYPPKSARASTSGG